jgi:predicted kinase
MDDSRQSSLILLRGLPGSGKSTLAEVLSENGRYPFFSVDDYFTDENGSYSFVFSENHLAYKQCEKMVEQAMINNSKKIIVHNTFTMEWEIEPYFKMASEHQYRVFVLTVENRHGSKNIHEIPEEHIQKMREKYPIVL